MCAELPALPPVTARDDYLNLMKKCLLAAIYDENGWYVLGSLDRQHPRSIKEWIKSLVVSLAWRKGFLIVKPTVGPEASGWGLLNYTMVGQARLDNVQSCVEDVLRNNVDGDLIETGVWRGGATIFMRAILKAYGVTDRTVWVADFLKDCRTILTNLTKILF